LASIGGNIGNVMLVAPAMCITQLQDASEILCTTLFVSGIITLLQSTLGTRSVDSTASWYSTPSQTGKNTHAFYNLYKFRDARTFM